MASKRHINLIQFRLLFSTFIFDCFIAHRHTISLKTTSNHLKFPRQSAHLFVANEKKGYFRMVYAVLTWFSLLLAQKNPNVATKSTITAWVSVFSLDFGPQYFSKMVTTSKNCSESDSWLMIACNKIRKQRYTPISKENENNIKSIICIINNSNPSPRKAIVFGRFGICC